MNKKRWSWVYSEWLFLLLAVVLIALKVPGVFTPNAPVGWDTFPHYYNFGEFVKFFSSGHISGYDVNQSGGTPLFYFYAPLGYVLGAVIKLLSFGALSDAVAFKLNLLFITCLYVFAFWFFIKTFIKNSIVSRLSIIFSLIFIFYPRMWANYNIGISSVFEIGLFTSFLGISTILFFLSFLNRFRTGGKKIDLIAAMLFGAATILSSLLSTFFLLFGWLAYALVFIKDKKFLLQEIAMGICMLLLSAIFLVPLIRFLPWSAADIGATVTQNAFMFLVAPFLNVFAYFNPENGLTSTTSQIIISALFYLSSLIITFFAFLGFGHKSEDKEAAALKSFSLVFFFFVFFGTSLTVLFRFLTIHYYRITPLFFTSFLALALLGISLVLEDKVKIGLNPAAKNIVIGTGTLLIIGWAAAFSFTARFPFGSPLLASSGMMLVNTPYHFNLDNYPHSDIFKNIVDYFSNLNPQRIFIEDDTNEVVRTGPPHTLFTLLNMAGHPTLNGLFAEDSIQNPLVMTIARQMFNALTWGYMPPVFLSENIDPIYYDRRKYDDPANYNKSMFERLRLFGVDYLILNSGKSMDEAKDATDTMTEVASFGENAPGQVEGIPLAVNYHIFHYNNPLPMIRRPGDPIGLYLDESKNNVSNFRNMEVDEFYSSDVFDMPIAFTPDPLKLTSQELDRFQYFIIDTSVENDKAFMSEISKLYKPVLYYHFQNLGVVINGDSSLPKFLEDMRAKFGTSSSTVPTASNISSGKISFSTDLEGTAPWIVALSYFPDWQSPSSTVFAVTPGQMLVFSKGSSTVNMNFDQGSTETAGGAISLISLLLLPILSGLVLKIRN